MRRLLLSVPLALIALFLVPGVASTSHQRGGPGGPWDFASGSVTTKVPSLSSPARKFRFSAHSGPSGERPRGHVIVESGATEAKGNVTCLKVNPAPIPSQPGTSSAVIEAALREPPFPGSSATHVVILVFDVGAESASLRDHAFLGFKSRPSPPGACSGVVSRLAGSDHGNANIHNATP